MDDLTTKLGKVAINDVATPYRQNARRPATPELLYKIELLIAELKSYVAVTENAVRNMYELLDGNFDLPWILLQNPTWSQDKPTFEQMFKSTNSLIWIEEGLKCAKISKNDVVILDVFPLVTDRDLGYLDERSKQLVTAIVFDITALLIVTFKPKKIISLQCHSRGASPGLPERWEAFTRFRGNFQDQLAGALGSSIRGALNRDTIYVETGEASIPVVQGVHPSYLLQKGEKDSDRVRLTGIIDSWFWSEYSAYGSQKMASENANAVFKISDYYKKIEETKRNKGPSYTQQRNFKASRSRAAKVLELHEIESNCSAIDAEAARRREPILALTQLRHGYRRQLYQM